MRIETMKQTPAPKSGNIIAVKLFDRMLDRQTKALSKMLENSIAEAGGRIRLLLKIESSPTARGPESLFEHLHFTKLHADQIEKMAIVGNRIREQTYIGLFGLFGGIETRYFERSEMNLAVTWLQE
jgi:hypothetical protein